MKVSFVSSQAISQALRYQMTRMQADLMKAEQEVAQQRVADVGITLGARTGYSVSLNRDVERLNGLIDSNELAASRLASTQEGLIQLRGSAQQMIAALTTAITDTVDPSIVRQEAEAVLAMMTSVLNSNLNGDFMFAGINTDVKPLEDFLVPGSTNAAAFDAAYLAHFGHTQDDPAAAAVTTAQMEDFLTNQVEPQFLGAGWETIWSSATDQQIVTRITLTETVKTSVSANIDPVRKLAMAAASVYSTMQDELSIEGQRALISRALELAGEAVVELGVQESESGIVQQRIESASERMSMQVDLFERTIGNLEGIDPYEASTRVTNLIAQIEISYSLTARMQQLSILRYL